MEPYYEIIHYIRFACNMPGSSATVLVYYIIA